MMNRTATASVVYAAKADFAWSPTKCADVTICYCLLRTIIALVQFA